MHIWAALILLSGLPKEAGGEKEEEEENESTAWKREQNVAGGLGGIGEG